MSGAPRRESTPGFWAGQLAWRATRGDALCAALLVLLGLATVGAGYRARRDLTPRAAVEIAASLDELDAPRRLPDAPLRDDRGVTAGLWGRIRGERAVVAFYADWCEPCQKELPELVQRLEGRADIIVVVSPDEDHDARRQLDNLGLQEVRVHADVTHALFQEGRVKSLPTTYLVTRRGHVLARVVGASMFGLVRLYAGLRNDAPLPAAAPVDAGVELDAAGGGQ